MCTIQHNVPLLPAQIQSDVTVTIALQHCKRNLELLPRSSAFLLHLTPLYPSEPDKDYSDTSFSAVPMEYQPTPEFGRMSNPVQPTSSSTGSFDAALLAQLRPRPPSDRSRQAPTTDRRDSQARPYDRPSRESRQDDRLRQERPASSASRRPDDRSEVDCLHQELAELKAQLSRAQPRSSAGKRHSDTKHFAGAAEEPDVPTFTALASFVPRDSDDSDPDVPCSFEQALTSHHISESPPWLASDAQPMPRPHNMPGRAGYRDYPPDYSNRYPRSRPL